MDEEVIGYCLWSVLFNLFIIYQGVGIKITGSKLA